MGHNTKNNANRIDYLPVDRYTFTVMHIKDKLKQLATETAQRSGVEAITFRELGKAVGIKSSSVVYHFQNKDGLLYAIVQDYSDAFFEALTKIDQTHQHVPDRLAALVDIFISVAAENKFCLCGMLASDINALDDKTCQLVQQFFLRLEQWIARAVQTDSKPLAAKPADLAKIIVSSLEGAMLLDKTDNTTQRLTAMKQWLVNLIS